MNNKIVSIVSLVLLATMGLSFLPPTTAYASPAAAAATPTPTAPPNDQYRWNLESIYPDTSAWEKDFATVKNTYIPKYKEYEGKLNDPDKLLELFKMDVEASRLDDKLYVYASMKRDEDQSSSTYSEMASRALSLYTEMVSASSFIRPELISLPQSVLDSYMNDNRFASYKHLLDELIKKKEHTLGKEEEKLLAMAGNMASAPETIATKIREADIQFPKIRDANGKEIQLSEDQYYLLLTKPDRNLRKRTFEGVLGAYNNSKNSLAAALEAQVRKDIFFSKARKYNSALESAVDDNNIPVDVYTNLLTTTDNNLDSLQKYVTLRKNILKLDKVHVYDMLVSLVGTYEKKIPYEETKIILNQALMPLGADYLANMNTGLNDHWIDVYPAENKNSGAYSWGSYDTHPFILANYSDTVDSLLEIGHEMGHAMNAYYTNQGQPYIYSNTPIFNAEIASTTNELLILRYLLNSAKDDNEKLYYLDKMAENIRGTFFTQVMYANFEKQIHDRVEAGDALSVDSLNKMWGDLTVKFYGPDFALDDLASSGWIRIPHFYYDFYVYQYSTGIAASNQFVNNLTSYKPGALDGYLKFLSAGGSNYPVDVLKTAGVDMTSNSPIDNLMAEFSNILDQMEVILVKQGKIKN